MQDINVLIERWQAGDEWAAASLYNRYRERTFRLAYGLLGNPADAEEAAQDALTYALLNISRYDVRLSKFSTWLHTITVSRCRDKQRKRHFPTLSLTTWLQQGKEQPSPEADPERHVLQNETRSQVWRAIQKLSPTLRETLVLRHWGGHTYQEIADIVGCPLGTAQSRVRLAYRHLEKALSAGELGNLKEELL